MVIVWYLLQFFSINGTNGKEDAWGNLKMTLLLSLLIRVAQTSLFTEAWEVPAVNVTDSCKENSEHESSSVWAVSGEAAYEIHFNIQQ